MQRRLPYLYKGWKVHHYVEGEVQYIAFLGWRCLRAPAKHEIEKLIDAAPKSYPPADKKAV